MSEILSYHSLIDRDSKYVGKQWRLVSIGLLFGAIIISGVLCQAFFSLQKNFRNYCFINATLRFYDTKTDNSTFDLNTNTDDGTKTIVISRNIVQSHVITSDVSNVTAIDASKTIWGSPPECDYYGISPLLSCIVAFIWLIMLSLCGHGGAGAGEFIEKPWRANFPLLVTAIIMACFNVHYLFSISVYLHLFCQQMGKELSQTKLHVCTDLMNIFALEPNNTFASPGNNFRNLSMAIWILSVIWIIICIWIGLRIISVADFQLVRISINTIESEEQYAERMKLKEDERKQRRERKMKRLKRTAQQKLVLQTEEDSESEMDVGIKVLKGSVEVKSSVSEIDHKSMERQKTARQSFKIFGRQVKPLSKDEKEQEFWKPKKE